MTPHEQLARELDAAIADDISFAFNHKKRLDLIASFMKKAVERDRADLLKWLKDKPGISYVATWRDIELYDRERAGNVTCMCRLMTDSSECSADANCLRCFGTGVVREDKVGK